MQRFINGIQQVGIGVADACAAFSWYKKYFYFDTVVFEDVARASLMHRYTGGEVHQRYAVLALNMQGGGGFEIWQYTDRVPRPALSPLLLGNLGIQTVKIKCRDIKKTFEFYSSERLEVLTGIEKDPAGRQHFYLKDPFGNRFQLIEDDYWFQQKAALTGGVCGLQIGVSNMEAALSFYQHVLEYKKVLFLGEEKFTDLQGLPGGNTPVKRAILKNNPTFCGAFSRLLGPTTVELIEVKNGQGTKIYEDRFWGDLGFIHVCYDLCSMPTHEKICEQYGQPLTVNSGNSFEMGEAAGQFAYNEDPDGTLIEYVETHKVPILKKLGWYLDLRKRKKSKPLPDWMIRCMGLSKKGLQLAVSSDTSTNAQAENGIKTVVATPAMAPNAMVETMINKNQ